jgi:hypothetical protein
MARYTEDTTITIPPNATNITIMVAAGSGGSGGDDGNPGGTGGGGRWGTFTLPSFTARTLTLRIGKRGGSGFGCVSNSGAGSGGASSLASGGGGGRTGPQGCSGGGGGGGGASGIYDSLKNGYIIVAGGGGGAGGASYPDSFLRGGNGGFGLGFETGNLSTISNGGTGASQGFDGGGGGGGGGGCPGGGGGREGADDRAGRYPSIGGSGGASSYDSNYTTFTGSGTNQFGDGYIDVNFILVSPSINTYTANPSAIILGQNSTLSWTTSNTISASIGGIGNVDINGSAVVSPQSTTTYTLTATGYGNQTTTRNVTVTVYIPPVLTLSLQRASITAGECTTLSWFTTGDADTIQWLSGSIQNFNLTSSTIVCPTDTFTYSARVSGLGGQDTDFITLVVNQVPTLNFTIPDLINYGDSASIQYESKYSNVSLNLRVSYRYTDNTSVVVEDIELPKASSAELNGANNTVSGTINLNIQYGDLGPRYVDIVMTASGSGGQITLSNTIEILIDITPDNIIIPETDDKFKSQDPVFSPETEVLSELLLVDDIDIPVEIKSNFPIQVDINGQND